MQHYAPTTPCQADPDFFFDATRIAKAKTLCATCPLIAECRELGAGEEYGVWGGVVSYGTQRDAIDELHDHIIERFDAGLSCRAIGRETGLDEKAVRLRVHAARPGVIGERAQAERDAIEARDARIIELYEQGAKHSEIERQLQLGRQTVQRVISRGRHKEAA